MSSEAEFDALMAELGSPALIVTVAHGGMRAGCLVGFGGPGGIGPPPFLPCLSEMNRTYRVAAGAEHLAVPLAAPGARDLVELFGGETGDEVDKFARCAWHEGPQGQPLLDACPDWFVARVHEQLILGDHVGFL